MAAVARSSCSAFGHAFCRCRASSNIRLSGGGAPAPPSLPVGGGWIQTNRSFLRAEARSERASRSSGETSCARRCASRLSSSCANFAFSISAHCGQVAAILLACSSTSACTSSTEIMTRRRGRPLRAANSSRQLRALAGSCLAFAGGPLDCSFATSSSASSNASGGGGAGAATGDSGFFAFRSALIGAVRDDFLSTIAAQSGARAGLRRAGRPAQTEPPEAKVQLARRLSHSCCEFGENNLFVTWGEERRTYRPRRR